MFYVQHNIRAGYGGGCLSRSFSTGFASLSDNISFFCLRPDSLLWRWFSHGKQQVEWKRSCLLQSSGRLLWGISNMCVFSLWCAGLTCNKYDSTSQKYREVLVVFICFKISLSICIWIKAHGLEGYLFSSRSFSCTLRLVSVHHGVVKLTCVIVSTRICLQWVEKIRPKTL